MPPIEPRSAGHSFSRGLWSSAGWIVAAVVLALRLMSTEQASNPGTPELQQLLDEYFQSWSRRDLTAYESCFHPQARIHHVDHAGVVSDWDLLSFVQSQSAWLAQAAPDVREIPLSKQIKLSGDLAQAEVRWLLTNGAQRSEGYDEFTLVRSPQGWKILALVYQEDRQP